MAQQNKTPSQRAAVEVRDRQKKYGHPADVYERAAVLITGVLLHKLTAPLDVHEVALIQVCIKLAREAENPNVVPDNRTDLCGYTDVLEMIYERRPPSTST